MARSLRLRQPLHGLSDLRRRSWRRLTVENARDADARDNPARVPARLADRISSAADKALAVSAGNAALASTAGPAMRKPATTLLDPRLLSILLEPFHLHI